MVITLSGNINTDKKELVELEKLASKGISDEEIADVVSDYENMEQQKTEASQSHAMWYEEYKRERAQENFRSGSGGFRRQ
jgi:SOS response regulatory protein OraA/RecX